MEEEKKELEVEEVKEEPRQEGGMTPQSKAALVGFILAVVGFGFAWAHLASFVGIILGIIALVFLKKNDPATSQQPFATFAKIAKIVAIVDIVVGSISFVVWLIVTIVGLVAAIAAAAQEGGQNTGPLMALFF